MENSLYVIGIDEVGRGPVAGPVVVCACAIKSGTDIIKLFPKQELRDSKKLTEKHRKSILELVKPLEELQEIVFGVGVVSAHRIDEVGISESIREAMSLALTELHTKGVAKESFIFLDGSLYAPTTYAQETVIKGDEKIPEISLASICAKEYRDSLMKEFSKQFPLYGFQNHMGYGTAAHYDAMKKHGFTELHRRSFLKKVDTNFYTK